MRADALDKRSAPGRESWAGWRQYLPTDLSAFLPYLPAALSALRLPYHTLLAASLQARAEPPLAPRYQLITLPAPQPLHPQRFLFCVCEKSEFEK